MNEIIQPVIVKATVLLLLAIAASMVLRQGPASHRAAVWQGVFLAVLLLPVLSLILPSWRLSIPSASTELPLQISALSTSAATAGTIPIRTLALGAWIFGFLLLTVRMAIGTSILWLAAKAGSLSEIATTANGQRIPVIASPRIRTPLLWSAATLKILVPERWELRSPAERALVLAHEMAHANRRDGQFQFLAQITCAVYWFHPLIWFAAAKLQKESEMACDDAVLRSGAKPTSYADVLLEAAHACKANGSIAPVSLAIARPSDIQSRIQSVLGSGVARAPLSRRSAALSAMFLLALMVPLAAMQSGEDDQTVYKINSEIVPPSLIEKREPPYTQEAKDAHIEGVVKLRIEIDRQGLVRHAEVVRGLDPGLDQNALDTVRSWRFKPARKAGKAVIVAANVEVNFRLL